MLTEITIRDFAIIDELQLQLGSGFNVMTGETGAGKSIILDAMSLVLGGRGDSTMIRSGCDRTYIEAHFRLSPALKSRIDPLLEAEGLEDEADDEADEALLLARELRANGRFICRVNGRTVTLSLLRQIGDFLVDIHGQGDHLSLLRPRAHLPLLDAYGGLTAQQQALGREVTRLRAIQRELAELRQSEANRAQRLDFLQFRIQEIQSAKIEPGEDDELVAERNRLGNAEHLLRCTAETLALLLAEDDDRPAALDLLGQAERSLNQLARLDDSQQPLLARLQGLGSELNDLAADLDDYKDQLEFNPKRLTFVEERLELLSALKRKYGGSLEAVLATADSARAEVAALENSEARSGELAAIEQRYRGKIGQLAEALSTSRQAVAQTLAAAVERELVDLGMKDARFAVDFLTEPAVDGVPAGGASLAFDTTGIDRVEFLISANLGEPLKPLARVASGGETARLMLALKTALARVDETPTLIFDEIDQGIGGRVGAVVGRKLWGLTAQGQHQVIVVTHLPQLAGYGDRHFHVTKHLSTDRTVTAVQPLEVPGRIQELAAMLGTASEVAREGAASILAEATAAKQKALG